jgi:hypothetical protein
MQPRWSDAAKKPAQTIERCTGEVIASPTPKIQKAKPSNDGYKSQPLNESSPGGAAFRMLAPAKKSSPHVLRILPSVVAICEEEQIYIYIYIYTYKYVCIDVCVI